MSSEFGYIISPDQEKFNNKGIFTPTDIYDLDRENKWTQFGQMNLLLTQNITGTPSTLDFTNIDSYGFYDIHCVIINDITITADNKLIGMELLSNGVASSTNYQVAGISQMSNGTFNDVKGTSYPALRLTDNVGAGTNEVANTIFYIYNALDSTKYSHITYHGLFQSNSNVMGSEFGSGCLPETRMDNGLRFHPDQNGSTTFTGGNFSLYGIEMT